MSSSNKIKVGICGAAGRMGKTLVQTLLKHPEQYELVFAVGHQKGLGKDIAMLSGLHTPAGVTLTNNLAKALSETQPDVVVELTHAQSVYTNVEICLQHKTACVVGASGLSKAQLEQLSKEAQASKTGLLFAPNFSVGAVLMMKFAQMASKYYQHAEIIERHHDKKLDAPSGTAMHTAALMSAANPNFESPKTEKELLPNARGAKTEGNLHIHSVRLPGSLAHQQVLLGALGETLTIQHDTLNREAFMGGILLAINTLFKKPDVYHGLEEII